MEMLDPSNTPGRDFPIPCAYPFGASFDGAGVTPKYDTPIPHGWTEVWIRPDDPEVEAAGFHAAEVWMHPETKAKSFERFEGAELLAYGYLRDDTGTLVATWDEGRWWTPEESDQFQAMLRGSVKPDQIRVNEEFWGPGSEETIIEWLKDVYDPATMPPLQVANIDGREGLWLLGWDGSPSLLATIFGEGYAIHRLDQVKADTEMSERIAAEKRGEYGEGTR